MLFSIPSRERFVWSFGSRHKTRKEHHKDVHTDRQTGGRRGGGMRYLRSTDLEWKRVNRRSCCGLWFRGLTRHRYKRNTFFENKKASAYLYSDTSNNTQQ